MDYELMMNGNVKIGQKAPEFDAITSKRQYKSHVGVCETLNILISESVPSKKTDTLKTAKNEKIGKVNPKVVKALIKVIIDDTEYEISCIMDYLKNGK